MCTNGWGPQSCASSDAPARDRRADLFRNLHGQIVSGELSPGSKLPPERELATRVGLTRTEIRSVLSALEVAGLVVRRVGRSGGTFVIPRPVERELASGVTIPSLLQGQGFSYASTLVRVGTEPPNLIERMLLPDVEHMIEVVRVRRADGSPLSVDTARFPLDRFPDLGSMPLDGSLYGILASRYGVRPAHVAERITAINADQRIAGLLGIAIGAATLCVDRRASDSEGVPFEFSRDIIRGDRLNGVVTRGEDLNTLDQVATASSPG